MMDQLPHAAKLCSPSGICIRSEAIYICENPSQKQGAVRVFSSLSGTVKFKNIWKGASVCFGMVSKPEKLVSKIKVDDARLRGLSATESLVSVYKVLLIF